MKSKIYLLIILISFLVSQGCISTIGFTAKTMHCDKSLPYEDIGGLGDIAGGYSLMWDKDEKFIPNFLRGAIVSLGILCLDYLICMMIGIDISWPLDFNTSTRWW